MFHRILACVAIAMALLTAPLAAQTYNFSNPSYLPTATIDNKVLTAPGDVYFDLQSVNTVSVRIAGTCTSLAGSFQVSNTPPSLDTKVYSAQTLYTVGDSSTYSNSITAPGFWTGNAAGMTSARVHITALTASCTVSVAGTH